jgi:hypothetical protein
MPSGADVYLGDSRTPAGKTPLTIGHNFRFYINGVLVHSAVISDIALDGKIGLVTRLNYSNVKFDDLSVRIIE